MGLWFWKPGETVNPQQPLSTQLYGQGDPGEGWSQARSATPASLADSFGGSGACSFDAPNRSDGMPDLLFGMDVQLYGSWSQVGKVTDVETDGDYTSYVVDDVLARFNKEVKVGPMTVGWQSKIFWAPDVNDSGEFDPSIRSKQARVGPDGNIWQGLWATRPGGVQKLSGVRPSEGWPWNLSDTEIDYFAMSSNPAITICAGMLWDKYYGYIIWFTKDGDYLGWSNVNSHLPQTANISDMVMGWDGSVYLSFTGNKTLVRCFPTLTDGSVSSATTVLQYENSDFPLGSQFPDDDSWGSRMHVIPKEGDDGFFLVRAIIHERTTSSGRWGVSVCQSDTVGNTQPVRGYLRTAGELTDREQEIIDNAYWDVGAARAPNGDFLVYYYSAARSIRLIWNPAVDLIPRTLPGEGPSDDSRAYLAVRDNGGLVLHPQIGGLAVFTVRTPAWGETRMRLGYYFEVVSEPTLAQAYFLYMLEAGVPLDIAIGNAQVFDKEVAYPDWEGNLLDKLAELAAVTRTQFSPGTLPGTVEVEEIGGTKHKQLPQAAGGKPSLSLGTGQAVDSYTVVSQQARVVNPSSPEIAWDARVENELIEFGLSEVKKVTLETPHSLASVAMPVRGLGLGEYAVADSEGNNITDAFEDAGGYVRATVNPDNPRAIDVEIFSGRGSIGANRPYSLGYRQTTNGQVIPRFSILGSGIFLNPQEATIWTGADPSFTTGGNGPRYESEFISSWDDAYSAANKISSMSVTPSMDVSLSVPDGVERGTGDVGDRFEHNHGVWRLMSVTTDGYTAQWRLQPSTTVGEHDQRWVGAKVSDHDSFWDGRTVQDVRVRPLWSDWEPYTGEPIFLKLDDDETPYWTLDPPPEAWVMVDSEDGPYWTPQNGPGTKVIKLDTDGKPYYIDEGEV